jgi:hypothetical protein
VARPSDCPVDNTLAVATVSAAQNGLSQPICMAMPYTNTMDKPSLMASFARVDSEIIIGFQLLAFAQMTTCSF